MKRFPTRTLVLMVLTLMAFGWMYLQTHRNPPPAAKPSPQVQVITLGADAGRAEIEQAISHAFAQALDAGILFGADR